MPQRLPLRDAVEKVPLWSADEAEELVSNEDPWGSLKAEWGEATNADSEPAPYRSDNPYQKIINWRKYLLKFIYFIFTMIFY